MWCTGGARPGAAGGGGAGAADRQPGGGEGHVHGAAGGAGRPHTPAGRAGRALPASGTKSVSLDCDRLLFHFIHSGTDSSNLNS